MTVQTGQLRGTTIPLSQLSIGSWHTYDRISFDATIALLKHAVATGITTFDVGVYDQPGHPPAFTDVIFGAAIRAAGIAPDDIQIVPKVWVDDVPRLPLRETLGKALGRMGVEHVPLGMLGQIAPHQRGLVDDIVEQVADLITGGIIAEWGVNNWPSEAVVQAQQAADRFGITRPRMAQLKYSVARRAVVERSAYQHLLASGLTLQPSDSLEGGILAGRTQLSRAIGRDPGAVREQIWAEASAFTAVAGDWGVKPAVLALAFVMLHPSTATVLFGATTPQHIDDAVSAVALAAGSDAEALRTAVEPFWADRDVEGLDEW